jgi:hypothetical protein
MEQLTARRALRCTPPWRWWPSRAQSGDCRNRLLARHRRATPEDGTAAREVMRRSIAELCVADHKNDPAILGRWLSNKTPETFRSWIRPNNSLHVAENDDILAVGCVTDGGEITLNYVSPDAGFCGVSTTLLASLEKRAIERGNEVCKLESAETARRFYLARGYTEEGPGRFGSTSGYPMSKRIKPVTRGTTSLSRFPFSEIPFRAPMLRLPLRRVVQPLLRPPNKGWHGPGTRPAA